MTDMTIDEVVASIDWVLPGIRAAIVTYAERRTVEAYLPANYTVRTSVVVDGRIGWLIAGEDSHGWTLDGYVIPRLASGLIPAYECDPETGARLA